MLLSYYSKIHAEEPRIVFTGSYRSFSRCGARTQKLADNDTWNFRNANDTTTQKN